MKKYKILYKIKLGKIALICSIFLISGITLFSQPRIKIVNPNVDFKDRSYVNSPIRENVVVKNIGSDTLIIVNVKPGCGCTAAPISSNRILPGDSATIAIEFDIKNFSGKTTKSVTVSSNDPNEPISSILLNVNVIRPFLVTPKYLAFDRVIVGQPAVTEVKIQNTSKSDAVVKNVIVDNPEVIVNIQKNHVLKKGETFNLKATAISTKPGNLQTNIRLELYHPDEAFLEISAYGRAIEKK